MDNLNVHHNPRIRKAVENTGATLIHLPPYSPDFNPIENIWSKIKTILRTFAARTRDAFQKAIRAAFEAISPHDLAAWFQHCGYAI